MLLHFNAPVLLHDNVIGLVAISSLSSVNDILATRKEKRKNVVTYRFISLLKHGLHKALCKSFTVIAFC